MSRLLAWCAGASCGYIFGWLAGAAVRDRAEARRLGRPGAPQPPSGHTESPEPRIGRENGAQRIPTQREGTRDVGDLHDRPDYQEALRRAEGMPWEPTVDLTAWMQERGLLQPLDEVAAEFGVDLAADEPCTARLGVLTCPFTGPHTAHAYQSGTWAPDRKEDDDTKVDL